MGEGKGNGKGGGEGVGGGEEGMASIKRGREKRRSVHQARYTTNQTPLCSVLPPLPYNLVSHVLHDPGSTTAEQMNPSLEILGTPGGKGRRRGMEDRI